MSGFWDETQLVGVSAISGDSGALLLTDSCRFPLGAVAFPHLSAQGSDSGLCKTLACAKCGCRESQETGIYSRHLLPHSSHQHAWNGCLEVRIWRQL